MTTKLEQAARQALEALGRIHFAATELDRRNRVRWFDDAVNEAKEAITALREALAEQACPNGCDTSNGRCVDCPDYVAEQAEQEPVYISESCAERGCACHYSIEVDGEPVAVYSTPVRTKDLPDDEIRFWIGRFPFLLNEESEKWVIGLTRVVIAADRELNK